MGTPNGDRGPNPLPTPGEAKALHGPSCPASDRPRRSPSVRLAALGAACVPPAVRVHSPRAARRMDSRAPSRAQTYLPSRPRLPLRPAQRGPAPSRARLHPLPGAGCVRPTRVSVPQLPGVRPRLSRPRCCGPSSLKPRVENDPGPLLTHPWTCLCPSSAG